MSTDVLRLALALAVPLAIGWLALRVVLDVARTGAALVASVSFALGFGLVTHEMFLLSIAGVRWPAWGWLALPWLLLVPVALVRIARGRAEAGGTRLAPASGFDAGPAEARVGVALALLLVVAFDVLTVHVLAIERPTWSFDALTRWMFKPKLFLADRSVMTYLADLERGDTQPHFPQLLSLAVTWVYDVLGRVDDRLGKVFFVAAWVSLLLGTYGLARRFASRLVALAAVAVLSAVPCLAYLNEPPGSGPPGIGAHTAMADVTLALYEVLALGILLLWREDGGRGRLVLSFALAGCAALTKQEGSLVLVVGFAVLLATLAGSRPGWRKALADLGTAAAVVLFLYLPWYLVQREVPITDTIYLPVDFSPAAVLSHMHRVPVIAARFLREMTDTGLWNVFWPLVAASVVLAPRAALASGPSRVLLFAVATLIAAYAAVYMLDESMGAEGYRTKMDLSLTRLLIHVAPIATLLFACQAEAVLRRALPLRAAR